MCCAHNFYVSIILSDDHSSIVMVKLFVSIQFWYENVLHTQSVYHLHVNLKFVKCKQRKPHVSKNKNITHTHTLKLLCLPIDWLYSMELCTLSWVEQKAVIFKQIGGWFWQYFFLELLFMAVMTEINIEFMRFNITNNITQHSTMVKLIITSYTFRIHLLCLVWNCWLLVFLFAFLKLLAL